MMSSAPLTHPSTRGHPGSASLRPLLDCQPWHSRGWRMPTVRFVDTLSQSRLESAAMANATGHTQFNRGDGVLHESC